MAVALLGADAATDDGSAPPTGIVPTKTTLAFVLALHRQYVGYLAPGTAQTLVEQWTIHLYGQNGMQQSAQSGADFRHDITLGPLHSANGALAGKGWHQNQNGEVVVEHGLHHLDAISATALRTGGAGVTLLGTVTLPVNAYVVKVAPTGGRLEYIFYNRKTGAEVRVERARRGRRYVTTYDDYRTTSGLTEAWHIHGSDGRPENDSDYTLTSLEIGKPVAASRIAVPVATSPVSLAGPVASIPISLYGDRIIIPVKMGGHTVDFQLDSGASGIVLDSSIVGALKLKTYGAGIGDTAGSYQEGSAVIPQATFGGVTLTNVVVDSAPFTTWAAGKPVAGLMGFDFIDGAVLHIDYLHGTLDAYDPKTFTPPTGAMALPIALDDDVPLITAGIAKAIGHLFILDTGADRSALFSQFIASHPSDVTDLGLGDQMIASFPFVTDLNGVGGTVKYRPLQVGPFSFAGYVFPKWLFSGTHDAPAFEGDDFDGLIGQDVLRNFDVYLDYAHEKVWLVPNERYTSRWG